jgi:Fanconi anemia group M protein
LYVLQGLPGVGPARAEQLLEAFGTVEAVMTASVDDLTAVESIGPKTARSMRWVVEETGVRYVPSLANDTT